MPLPRPQGALLSLHQPHILDALRLVCMGPGESESRLPRPCPGSTAPTHTLPATHLHTQLWCPPQQTLAWTLPSTWTPQLGSLGAASPDQAGEEVNSDWNKQKENLGAGPVGWGGN